MEPTAKHSSVFHTKQTYKTVVKINETLACNKGTNK